MDNESIIPITDFDKTTLSDSIQMTKAIIPFLDFSMQRTFSMMIRMQEMMQTMEFYNNSLHATQISSSGKYKFSLENIAAAISPYCSSDMRNMINTFSNFSQMSNIYNMYHDMEQNSDFQSIINMLTPNSSSGDTVKSKPAKENSSDTKNSSCVNSASANSSSSNDFAVNLMNDEQKDLYKDFLNKLDNSELFKTQDNQAVNNAQY